MDPTPMLEFLPADVSERRLRHFLVACARRVLPGSPDTDMLQALAVAEQFADGTATRHQLTRARSSLKTNHQARVSRWHPLYSTHIRSVPAWHATREAIIRAAREGARCCAWSSTRKIHFGKFVGMEYPQEELAAQASLLRDIFGPLPFRPLVVSPSLLNWRHGFIPKLAQAAYENRILPSGHLDLARLGVLADALEEAGSSDAELLGHLRGPGPHTRGCHAIDLLLCRS
jgi:hypothetical protein